ncbi:MAG: hypothetical protein ACRDTT_23320, partial [Pseudonocardiaceae bacterium]
SRSRPGDRFGLNRRVTVEVVELLVDEVQIEILLVTGYLEYLDDASRPHLLAFRHTLGNAGPDDEDGVLSDLVPTEGQRMRPDDSGDLTDQLNLLSDPILEAALGSPPLALFTHARLL